MMSSMWCVVVKGLPLGVTPSALQRACEEALNERPVWPQLPKIYDDEALVYLQARDMQSKLASTSVKLRVGGIIVSVKRVNLDEAKAWIAARKPERKKNPAPSSNIHKYLKQQKREQRKINQAREKEKEKEKENVNKGRAALSSQPPGFRAKKANRRIDPPQLEPLKKGQHQRNTNQMTQTALYDILPKFNEQSNNNIIWYQYLIFVKQEPFYVTYPATWSWDIEGQWIKFQEEYSLNQSEAEKNHSRFKIGELNSTHSSHAMIGDLLNMKVTDKLSGKEYELKRTNKLIGKLINYGQVEFVRYFDTKEKEIFLYDRRSGYDESVECEDDVKIGEQVIFEAWWNKDDNDQLIFDFRNTIINIQRENNNHDKIHGDMVAFNIRCANSEDVEDLTGYNRIDQYSYSDHKHDGDHVDDGLDDLGQQLNPLMPANMYQVADLSKTDPLAADDFAGQRFEGLLITLRNDNTGLIVCFPYKNAPDRDVTLLFHTRFVRREQDKEALSVNMNLEFNICVNPQNFGQGLYGFVATDIVISEHGFSNNIPFPVTMEKVNRRCKGQIIVAPVIQHCGWIYNKTENNMCQLHIAQKEQLHDYRVGMHLRYNELKQDIEQNNDNDERKDHRQNQPQRHLYDMIAFDVLPVEKIENVDQYLTSDNYVHYKAKKYILERKLKIDEDRNIEFKYIAIDDDDSKYYSDLYLIVDLTEHYLNAFLNTSGGAIIFGIADDGTIIGQELMTKNKRDYIRNAIGQRVSHFKPSVPSEYYDVQFREMVDMDGYVVPDTYIIVVEVAKLFDGDDIQQHVKFLTSQGGMWERRVTSVGGISKCKELTHLTPQQHRILYSKRSEKGSTSEIHFGLKPRFVTFDGINGKPSGNYNHSDDSDDDDDDDDHDDVGDNKQNHDVDDDHGHDSDTTQPQIAASALKQQRIVSGAEDEGRLTSSEISNHSSNHLYSPNAAIPNQNRKEDISGLSQSLNQMNLAMAAGNSNNNNNYNFNQFDNNNNNNNNNNYDVNLSNIPVPLQYTTPQLNSLRVPDDTEQGRHVLAQRVQTKLNAMMMITDYIIDPQWNSILTMSANPMYNPQKTTWLLLQQLEQRKVRERSLSRAKIIQQRQRAAAQKEQQRQQLQQQQIQQQQAQLLQQQQMLEMQRQAQLYNDASFVNVNDINLQKISSPPPSQPNASNASPAMINQDIPISQPLNTNNQNEANVNVNNLSIGEQFAKNFGGSEPSLDRWGLPILPDKSKYKAVAMEYCQKMGWKRPVEAAQMYGSGYRATVTFGKPNREKSESGDGLKQKTAIYEAYLKLIPRVIPKASAIELMVKWVPGYKKAEKVCTATTGQQGQSIMKHPKSVLLEWAQKNSIAPPKTTFSEYADSTRNLRIWTAKVVFCGKTIEAKGGKKKDAESKCFQELLKHVMSGGISTQ